MITYKDFYKEIIDENIQSIDLEYHNILKSGIESDISDFVKKFAFHKGYKFGPVLHSTKGEKFNKFDKNKFNVNSVWGPAIYASIDAPWTPPGHDLKIMNFYVRGKILDGTKPMEKDEMKIFSDLIGREVDVIPFISLEKRYGSVSAGIAKAGFSGFIHHGPNGKIRHIAIFNPNDLKLSDGITYDDADEIIPISKRFNDGSDDVRY